MSRIPSFGFRSKLKAPTHARGKAEERNEVSNTKIDSSANLVQPSTAKSSDDASLMTSYENGLDTADNDDAQSEDGDSTNNNITTQTSSGKKILERTSNSLSKLADKLNAGKPKPTGEFTSKLPQKPAFRRRGSSNIAKLNTGKGKERTGATQIHGQTPYTKSPKLELKPPTCKPKAASGIRPGGLRNVSRLSAIPGTNVSINTNGEKEKKQTNANETFKMAGTGDGGGAASRDISSSSQEITRKTSAANVPAATSTTTTSTTMIRRQSAASAGKSGLRPPSGNFSASSIGPGISRTDTKMRPPSGVPSRGSRENLLKGNEESTRATDSKGVAVRRGGGQVSTMVKRGSKDNLKTSGIVTPRQKGPSKELQSMAEKLISYTGKKMQRPLSVSSASDLVQSASKTQVRGKGPQSLALSNLRSLNSSSLQNLARSSSNQDLSNSGTRRRRSGSFTLTEKENSLKKTKGGSSNSLSSSSQGSLSSSSQGIGINSRTDAKSGISTCETSKSDIYPMQKNITGVVLRKKSTGLVQPRPRSSSKTLSSTNSEFGLSELNAAEPYQSTPVSKNACFEHPALAGATHPLQNVLTANISAVFDDDSEACEREKKTFAKQNNAGTHRVLNQTFDGEEPNRTFDANPVKNDTYVKTDLLQPKETLNSTFSKPLQPSVAFGNDCENDANETFNLSGPKLASQAEVQSESVDTQNTEDILDGDSSLLISEATKAETVLIEEVKTIPSADKQFVVNSVEKELDIEGYCSDDFLINESMPCVDGSLEISITDELRDVTSSSPMKENVKKSPIAEDKQNVIEQTCDASLPKSASRSLNFDGKLEKERQVRTCVEDVLARSLINDSYDIVTVEEASESGENLCVDKSENMSNVNEANDKNENRENSCKVEEAPKENEINPNYDGTRSSPIEISQKKYIATEIDYDTRGTQNEADTQSEAVTKAEASRAASEETGEASLAPNRFQIKMPAEPDQLQTVDSTHDEAEKKFSSLLSQTVETLIGDTIVNNKTDNVLSGLLTPIDSVEAKSDSLSSLPPSQMKIAAKRRSLIRRNTSPYGMASDSLSLGTSFRIPREASIAEMEDGNVLIDEATFRHCQNDVRIIKTNLLRLKRFLHEADIMSPFVKHPNKHGTSPPITPTRPLLLSRSFSDASSWLTKSRRTPDISNSCDPVSRLNAITAQCVNKTDEDKVGDEMKEMREKVSSLERELEELKHDMETKDFTIKLLQTQLENEEQLEQIELLTEEKIMLIEENQELKETIAELENPQQARTPSMSSIKDEYLKQSRSASKMKAEIVQGYYTRGDE